MNAAAILQSSDYVTCQKYNARLSRKTCLKRQELARVTRKYIKAKHISGLYDVYTSPMEYCGCLKCKQGQA